MELSFLDRLEAESIYILREVAAQFRRPVLLFSGGKDSIVMTRLSEKAFRPGKFPFPLMLIDTGHNFPETLDYIQKRVQQLGERYLVGSVQKSIDEGRAVEEKGPFPSRNRIQAVTLMEMIREHQFDAVIGGARRDEEKARAKERIFSVRDDFGQWEPHNQRPELWDLLNGQILPHEHVRAFPLSNWTELDVWQYIEKEKLDVPSIYFSHRRKVVKHQGSLLALADMMKPTPQDVVSEETVRFRTVGDMTCTGGVLSKAASIADVITEIRASRVTERGGRFDDKRSETAMEDRKKEGYF